MDRLIVNSRTKHWGSLLKDTPVMTKKNWCEVRETRHASRWTQSGVTDSERVRNEGANKARIGKRADATETGKGILMLPPRQRPLGKFCFPFYSNRRTRFIFII